MGENVTFWDPSDFTGHLNAVTLFLKLTNEILINGNFTNYRCFEYNPYDIQGLQNILREVMNPANIL
ncbi:unnamed protein product [Didymodactylos carnosus]|uniref:Uncharacterized protein n=1 Tax=Didymodactylos carnosus TaxID=1234261 RepID=A0A8S2YTP2_9BILA|nr:unnamed protein product [Didymodactylos carnosus]